MTAAVTAAATSPSLQTAHPLMHHDPTSAIAGLRVRGAASTLSTVKPTHAPDAPPFIALSQSRTAQCPPLPDPTPKQVFSDPTACHLPPSWHDAANVHIHFTPYG